MPQVSLIREEVRDKGAKRTIKLAAILASATKQYTKESDKLKGVIREYGHFNQVTVINNGAVDIEISLDFTENKTYPVPGSSSICLEEVIFQEFNVTNLDAGNPTVINKITVIPSYEKSLLREPIIKKIGTR